MQQTLKRPQPVGPAVDLASANGRLGAAASAEHDRSIMGEEQRQQQIIRRASAGSACRRFGAVPPGATWRVLPAAAVPRQPAPAPQPYGVSADAAGRPGRRAQPLRRQQDDDLDLLGAHVVKIGAVGRAIHDELGTQSHMLEELEQDTEETQTRLQARSARCGGLLCRAPVAVLRAAQHAWGVWAYALGLDLGLQSCPTLLGWVCVAKSGCR